MSCGQQVVAHWLLRRSYTVHSISMVGLLISVFMADGTGLKNLELMSACSTSQWSASSNLCFLVGGYQHCHFWYDRLLFTVSHHSVRPFSIHVRWYELANSSGYYGDRADFGTLPGRWYCWLGKWW